MNNDERIIGLLEDLVAWARLSARDEMLPFLKEVLADPKHLKAFDLTDGHRTQQQVADGAGLSQPSVSLLWSKWRRLGILREKNGKPAHIVSPSDYGLDLSAASAPDGKPPSPNKAKGRGGKVAPALVQPVEPAAGAADGVQAQ